MAFISLFLLGNSQCRKLHTYGFRYTITGGKSPTWDTVNFYFFRSAEESNVGPRISGSCLKVECRDIDGDDLAEFIIQSNVTKPYKTILKVTLDSGSYHVQYTEGLKVSFPQEGFYYQ